MVKKIFCRVWHPQEKVTDIDITIDGRVWPCCDYCNASEQIGTLGDDNYLFRHDEIIQKAYREDPDWNNLKKKTLDEIQSHYIFKTYLNQSGWESDNPPPLCVYSCSVDK